MATAQCRLTVSQQDNDLTTYLICDPAPRGDPAARNLLDLLRDRMTNELFAPPPQTALDLGAWLDGPGFIELVTLLLSSGAKQEAITEIAHSVAAAIKAINGRYDELKREHLGAIMRRDLAPAVTSRCTLTTQARWALAPEYSRRSIRPTMLLRRRQAGAEMVASRLAGGEERLEHLFTVFLRDAASCVGNDYLDCIGRFRLLKGKLNRSSALH